MQDINQPPRRGTPWGLIDIITILSTGGPTNSKVHLKYGRWLGRRLVYQRGLDGDHLQRVKVLYFAQPYYTSPAVLFIHAANTSYSRPSELSGGKIGVLRGSTYQSYLDGTLSLPGVPLDFPIRNAQVAEYDDDNLPLVALATGEGGPLDAVLTSQALGLQAIAAGQSLKQLGDPVFIEYLAPAIDRASPLDPRSFVDNVSNIVASLQRMALYWISHDDGTRPTSPPPLHALIPRNLGSSAAALRAGPIRA